MFGYPTLVCPTEPTDCSTQTLPVMNGNECVNTWDIRKSAFKRVFFGEYDGTLTPPIAHANMEDAATWNAQLDNTTATLPASGIRYLYVDGDLPAPEKEVFTYKTFEKVLSQTFTANFDVIDVVDANYTFARQIDAGLKCWFAFETEGGSLFGWMVADVAGDLVLNRGNDAIETLTFTAKWTEFCKPPRYDSPFAT